MLRMTFVWAFAVLFGNVMGNQPTTSSELSAVKAHLMRMEAMVGSTGSVGLVGKSSQEDQGKIAGKHGSPESLVTDLSAVDDHRAADGIDALASPTEFQDPIEEAAGYPVEGGGNEGDGSAAFVDVDNSDDDASAKQQFLAPKSQHLVKCAACEAADSEMDESLEDADADQTLEDADAEDMDSTPEMTAKTAAMARSVPDDALDDSSARTESKFLVHEKSASITFDDADAEVDSGDDVAAKTTSKTDHDAARDGVDASTGTTAALNPADYVDNSDYDGSADQQLLAIKSQEFAGETAASSTQEGEDADANRDDAEQPDGKGEQDKDAYADVNSGADVFAKTISDADNDAAGHEDEVSAGAGAAVNPTAIIGLLGNSDDDYASTDQQLLATKSQYFAGETAASITQEGEDAEANAKLDDADQDSDHGEQHMSWYDIRGFLW